jgi:hypothetical protein
MLPHHHDLLAALVQSIKHLSETNGGSSEEHVRRLLNDSGWQLTGSPFRACQHDDHVSCWNQPEFLQKITPIRSNGNNESSSLHDPVNDAVVFGGRVKAPWFSFSSPASGQYQNSQDTTSVSIKQEQAENATQVLVRSN